MPLSTLLTSVLNPSSPPLVHVWKGGVRPLTLPMAVGGGTWKVDHT